MNTFQLICIIALAFLVGIMVGIIISNVNHNRFLIKHGINPKKFYKGNSFKITFTSK